MKKGAYVPWVLGGLTAVLLCAAFPKPDQGWLSLFALVPWLTVIYSDRRPGIKIGVTAVTFIIFFAFSMKWLWLVTWLGFPPLVLYLTIYPVLFSLIIGVLGSERVSLSPEARRWLQAISAPFVWTALEYLRGDSIIEFPWFFLGHTLHATRAAQAVDIIGVYGLSFLIAGLNSALVLFIGLTKTRAPGQIRLTGERIYLAVMLVLMMSCWGYGTVRLSGEQSESVNLRVGVVQANVDKYLKYDPSKADLLLDVHLNLSRQIGPCDIIVWPETSVPVSIVDNYILRQKVSAFAKEIRTHLLIGVIGRKNGKAYNSALLIAPSGEFIGRYDKIHLVPFGEYIPLPRLLSSIVKRRVFYKEPFEAGSETVIFNVKNVPFSVVICFESIFPDLVKSSVEKGARLLINMTSEGWFGSGAELEQHLAMARMNAIRYRVPIVRAANTGISAYIDHMGGITRSPKLVKCTSGVDVFVVRVPK